MANLTWTTLVAEYQWSKAESHSAVEMLHDSALYKFMIDIDIIL